MLCAAIAFLFFGLLKAGRVGDFVFLGSGEFKDKAGIVKSIIGDNFAEVKVFLHEPFLGPIEAFHASPLDSFFQTAILPIEELDSQKVEYWKDSSAQLSFKVKPEHGFPSHDDFLNERWQQFSKYFSVVYRLEQSKRLGVFSKNLSEEEAIVGIWLNREFGLSFLPSLPNLSPFKKGAFVFIHGLSGNFQKYNGYLGVIVQRLTEKTEVLIMSRKIGDVHSVTSLQQALSKILVSDNYMRLLSDDDWDQVSPMAKFTVEPDGIIHIVNRKDKRTLSTELMCIEYWMREICQGKGLDNIALKGRLLGAWVNLNYGWEGMEHVVKRFECEEKILKLWTGIGKWKIEY